MLGRVLASRFTILGRIGSGSMGTVYRAKQSPMGRDVAVKILRSDRAVDEVSRARFLREARANSLLTSPNTVTVFDFGQGDTGDFYLAMELLEGESLGHRIKRLGRIGVDESIDTAKQALRSLAEAHAKGIIHRDLKPDNLFYARVRTNEKYEEIVKVLDFGIAKMLQVDADPEMNAIETQAGTVFGTPRYMSPEQAQGKLLDSRSDLYSLGVILYHMLTGKPPFTDDDAIVVMARHIKTTPRPLSEVAPDARIPHELESLVMRVLAKEPDRRPESADVFSVELSRVREAPVVGSGIRASIGVVEAASEMAPTSTPNSVTYDTLTSLEPASRRSRRWMLVAVPVALAIGSAAMIAGNVGPFGGSRAARPAAASTSMVERSPSQPGQAGVGISESTSAPSSAGVEVMPKTFPLPSAGAPAALPSASSTSLHPERQPHPARSYPNAQAGPSSPGTKPAPMAPVPSVGYGYLE